ncbi:alcohol dehydrogenase catalytic domain-containing protein [Arthrobacter sp. zg-Y859]|uniref:Alcohol dehydrogenase catalytic domain-containing protein n=1 Tax=Arthrobacter jinronghuae TaxID=2964609 RepID=A0ABT1NLR3_9MICC|nr:alcohol dehydrogenase catalytic domain-containing protein [Arthrobacter jinronghuae]MCQ1948668.1 alcohol dehydrogenase catalytic domain-containing protein [Arthrobacter jinronghuae]UWX78519.1 alcohol dehydrogenase catalytic domain-containing protein [Arthrobacter jinronghuae]
MGTDSTRSIRGAVLQTIGAPRPYAQSRPVVVQDLQLQPPGPGEIMVRIEAASLCHSDLSVVNGSRVRPLPMLLGHEAAGKVEELGEGVEDLAVGQRVVMAFLPRCGECAGCRTEGKMPCIPGSAANNAGTLLDGGMRLTSADGGEVRHHLGVSGFATHAVVNRKSVVPVDDDIPPHVAALLGCAVLTGGGAVLNPARPGKDDDVAIVGLGGVGMAALLTALSLDVRSVIGIDSLPEKLARARELGADAVYTPQEALDAGIRPALVIEAAGHPRAFETAVRITAPGGTTVTVGLPAPDQTSEITPLTLTAEARTIIGSYLGSAVPARDIPVYAQLWREGKLPVEELVSSTIALEDINSAMDTLADGLAIRQVIRFGQDGGSA